MATYYVVTVKPLEPPDYHYLSAAVGWLGLGDCQESLQELEKISPQFQTRLDVMQVKWVIHAKSEKWAMAADVAKALRDACPENSQFWINLAYATRRMPGGGLENANNILVSAEALFPRDPIIPYNLACYACQLGDLKSARKWVESAFKIGDPKSLRLMALEDHDLQPLWAEISKI